MRDCPHTHLINDIIKKKNYQSYLEIGVALTKDNFDKIDVKFKIGVDPDKTTKATFIGTSDEFFKQNKLKFDIIFIDGLHHADQVERDFDNSLQFLNEGGLILIHDTDPKKKKYSVVPRTEKGRWNGDVFKFIYKLPLYPVEWRTVDVDKNGLTIVRKHNHGYGGENEKDEITFKEFIKNRKQILQLCTKGQFDKWI